MKALRTALRVVKDITISMGYVAFRAPGQIVHVPSWLWSLLGRTPLAKRKPMLPHEAIRWLDEHLTKDMSVFEFGSGASTLFFASRVGRLVSVEHHEFWHGFVQNTLDDLGFGHCEYLHASPKSADGETDWGSLHRDYAGMDFFDYVNTIGAYPDHSFDLVLVDGRARICCLRRAIQKVRPGGYLLLDDTRRSEYDIADEIVPADCIVFTGIHPGSRDVGQTKIWQMPV
jgi:hypothetical protein